MTSVSATAEQQPLSVISGSCSSDMIEVSDAGEPATSMDMPEAKDDTVLRRRTFSGLGGDTDTDSQQCGTESKVTAEPQSVPLSAANELNKGNRCAELPGIIVQDGSVGSSVSGPDADSLKIDEATPREDASHTVGTSTDPATGWSSMGSRQSTELGMTTPPTYEEQTTTPDKPRGFFSFLWSELSRGYLPDENEAVYNVKKERVYAFLKIPKECEQFMFYGWFQCVDSFLFIFTFLPLRLLIILLKLLSQPRKLILPQQYLSASQKCDVIKGIIIAAGYLLLLQVDVSMIYHIIRGQAIIKLYIFFNLLDIGDKLLSSFGQDILDALMWTVADSKTQRTVVVLAHMIAATIYVFLHSMLVLLQANALNVAFNSHNKALLTILISNNAVELKGSVFKKFEKTNLFQIACSDVRERFHLQILILIVCIRNMTDFNWDIAHLGDLIPDIIMLLVSEMIVDETKHAFITKFNNIKASVYREYTVLIANDVITSRKKKAFSDVSDQVSRRLGLIPLPLACLLMKILYQCIKIQTPLAVVNVILCFFVLVGAKMVIGVVVYGWAVEYWQNYQKEQAVNSRQRHKHKSGLDQDLLLCENNYHWKRPTIPKPPTAQT